MPTTEHSALLAIARRFEKTVSGRTGQGARDLLIEFEELLSEAGCHDGDPRALAKEELFQAEKEGLIVLERPRLDRSIIQRVRLPLGNDVKLFDKLKREHPESARRKLAGVFNEAAQGDVPSEWKIQWKAYCEKRRDASLQGVAIAPFTRDALDENRELLAVLKKLLAWQGESLIRFASCVLCGDSKRLQSLRPKLERAMDDLSGGTKKTLDDFGIIDTPRTCLIHGPLRVKLGGQWLDLGLLTGPIRLSELDIRQAEEFETNAVRCVTIENETTFQELAKLRSGDLLIQTSFPGAATLQLLKRLPATMAFWQFGDSDPAGFDILRDLRERTGLTIRSLHMRYRPGINPTALTPEERRLLIALVGSPVMADEKSELEKMLMANDKGQFEQESLGRPTLSLWPYY